MSWLALKVLPSSENLSEISINCMKLSQWISWVKYIYIYTRKLSSWNLKMYLFFLDSSHWHVTRVLFDLIRALLQTPADYLCRLSPQRACKVFTFLCVHCDRGHCFWRSSVHLFWNNKTSLRNPSRSSPSPFLNNSIPKVQKKQTHSTCSYINSRGPWTTDVLSDVMLACITVFPVTMVTTMTLAAFSRFFYWLF